MPDDRGWPKTCGCGATWSWEAWRALPLVGTLDAGHEVGDGELELRNCTCGSTLAVARDALGPMRAPGT